MSVIPFPSWVSRIPSLSSSTSISSLMPSPSKSSLTTSVVTAEVSATAQANPRFVAITLYWYPFRESKTSLIVSELVVNVA